MCISFLDVLITQKNDGKMEKGVYRKPIHTDVILTGLHTDQIFGKLQLSDDISLNTVLNRLETIFTNNNNNNHPKREQISNIIKSENLNIQKNVYRLSLYSLSLTDKKKIKLKSNRSLNIRIISITNREHCPFFFRALTKKKQ